MRARPQAIHVARDMQMVGQPVQDRIHLSQHFAIIRHGLTPQSAILDEEVGPGQVGIHQRHQAHAGVCADSRNVLATGDGAAAQNREPDWLCHPCWPPASTTAVAGGWIWNLSAARVTSSYPICAMILPHADSITATDSARI